MRADLQGVLTGYSFLCLQIRSPLVRSFVYLFAFWFARSFVCTSVLRSFTPSFFVRSFPYSCVTSFVPSLLFVRWVVWSLLHSLEETCFSMYVVKTLTTVQRGEQKKSVMPLVWWKAWIRTEIKEKQRYKNSIKEQFIIYSFTLNNKMSKFLPWLVWLIY